MATKIKDSATAENAALNLNTGIEAQKTGEPTAPREKTTSERLFPEFVTADGGIINRPITKDVVSAPSVAETPAQAPQTQTPQTQAPTIPAYIKAEDLAGKMAKIKVDGVEQDVPASDLFKLTQLERHSNAQLMKLAQERAQLERDRQEFLAKPAEQKPVKQEPVAKKAAEVEALEARLAQMEQSMAQERALLMPQIQEAGITRVEKMVKERIGSDDFRSYFDKIKESALEEVAKPEIAANPQARAYFDSDAYYFQKYQEMKLRDVVSKPSAPAPTPTAPTAPVLQTQQGAPVLVNNQGQPVSMPTFESSSGVPSSPSEQGNWQGTYSTLLTQFRQNPTDANALALMRHKFRNEG